MKNNNKRTKKLAVVYLRGEYALITLGHLTDVQVELHGLNYDQHYTDGMQSVLDMLVSKTVETFAPMGVKDKMTLHKINTVIKGIFGEISSKHQFRDNYIDNQKEYLKSEAYAMKRIKEEKLLQDIIDNYEGKKVNSLDLIGIYFDIKELQVDVG